MMGKMEIRTPPGTRPRDGRHCDLCGCSQPAVRCDKCGCQIFCLSCDDMYHRHPKRRFHLRKAVDPSPSAPQARPVLPVKVSHLTASPGDPSKMPLPPPRKKKSLFGSFRKPSPSPSSDNSPPLPKKEYSWTDRLGSIKKFMSNRPLPPLPNSDDNDMETQPTTNGQSNRGDLTFIHRRTDDRPPQLPQRSPRSPGDFPGVNQEKENRLPGSPPHMPGQMRNGALEPNSNHMNQNREFPNNEEQQQWNNMMNNQNGPQRFGTLNRQNHQRGFMPPGAPGYPGGMHQSSSATDLHNMQNAEGMHGGPQVPPHFPHYPMNPHMPPHYPYPMYPQFPNYPQYFGNSFANLSNPPTSEGDFSDHSESTNRYSKKHPFRKRAKRSQSVMMDRMQFPGQFFPFGPYPGYGPWGAPMPMEAPPSPASSVRSLNRSGRNRRRKKLTSEDDDEEFSVSSSPLSRPKSSSSDPKDQPRAQLTTQTSSEDESDGEVNNRRNKLNTIQRRQSDLAAPQSPVIESKRMTRLKKSSSKQSDSDVQEVPDVQNERRSSRDSNSEQPVRQQPSTSSGSSETWECKHCTYVNPIGNRICQVCCKTATPRTETPVTTQSRPASAAAAGSRKHSVDSENVCSSPEKYHEAEDDSGKKEKQDMASLNSALDEAEKQISKGLEELMKLRDDIDDNISNEKSKAAENQQKNETEGTAKPVYKSSGKMRTSILDKLNLNKPQTANNSVSTSIETQTGQNNWTSDKIIEARRHSNSSTTSETYNSPMAQSPELERGFRGNMQKRDSSCQTQQDSIAEYLEKKKSAEEAFLGRPMNNFGFGYGDRMDMMTSPVPSMYDRYFGGGYGMMQRSHSRASLFTGRMNDLGPMEYGGPGFGYGQPPMYRSISRSSLTGDYPEGRMSEFHNLRKPDFYLSMEELVERRRQDNIRAQGLELVRMIREAEQQGFNADDIQVALTHCGKQNPMEWLQENWRNMVDSVVTLSTNYGNDKKENDIGLLSENEARDALRLHKGNIWAAVTECVEGRQRKYLELSARGNFSIKDIVDALTSSEGDVELAYAKLSKSTGKPFLMRIWGAGEGVQNQDGARPIPEDINDVPHRYLKDETLNSDEISEEIWSEDGDVEWDDEEEEYGEEKEDIEDLQTCHEDLQTCHEDLQTSPQEMRTPESDKSDYCDAFPVDDRNASSPSDDIFFVIPEAKPEKKRGFLSKLAALRKDSKEHNDRISNVGKEELVAEQRIQSKEDSTSQNSASSSEQPKNNGALNALKNTLSAIKDTVTGGPKTDKKLPCAQPEKRTIIVRGQLEHESLSSESKDNVKLTSVKPLEHDILPTPVRESETKLINEKTNDVMSKEEMKPECVGMETINVDLKYINQPQTNKNTENVSKLEESKSKIENKRPQSLAERLKFAKRSASTSNSSSVKNVNSTPESPVKDAVNLVNNKEKIPSNGDNVVYKYAEGKSEMKLESNSHNQILNNGHLITEKENKLNNTVPDLTQSSKYPSQQNVNAETKLQCEVVASATASSVETSPTETKPTQTEGEELHTKNEDSSDKKTLNQTKQTEKLPDSKTEDTARKKVVAEKVSENISLKLESPRQDKPLVISLNTNAVKELDTGSTPQLLDTSKTVTVTKSDATKGTSSSLGETAAFEIKTTSNDLQQAQGIMKTEEQIPASSTVSGNVTTSSKEKDVKVNEPIPNDHSQNGKQNKEMDNIPLEDSKLKSGIQQTTMPTVSEKSLETSFNKPSEVKSENAPLDENVNHESLATLEENKTINNSLDVSENADHSQIANVEGTSSSNNELLANSSNKSLKIESENHANQDVVTEEQENTVKETETTKIIQENNFEQVSTDKPQSNHPISQVDSSQNVSVNQINEQAQQLSTTSLIQSIPDSKLNESNGESSNSQPEAKNILLQGNQTIPEKSPEIEILNQTNTEQNLVNSSKEIISSNEMVDSSKKPVLENEVAQSKDEESKSIQNLEAKSESSQKAADTNLNHAKYTAETVTESKKDSPSASNSEDTRIGKFKFSKSGKVKKTQVKDDKESKSQIKDKNQIKAGTTATSLVSLNKSSSIAAEKDNKPSTSYDDGPSSNDISTSSKSITELDKNESSEKVLNEKETENKSGIQISEAEGKSLTNDKDIISEEENKLKSTNNELEISSGISSESQQNVTVPTEPQNTIPSGDSIGASSSKDNIAMDKLEEVPSTSAAIVKATISTEPILNSINENEKILSKEIELQEPVVSKQFPGIQNNSRTDIPASNTSISGYSNVTAATLSTVTETVTDSNSIATPQQIEQHSKVQDTNITDSSASVSSEISSPASSVFPTQTISEKLAVNEADSKSQAVGSDDSDIQLSDESRPSSVTPPSPVDALRNRFEVLAGGSSIRGPIRPQSPFRRMSFNSRKQVIALERKRETEKPWFHPKIVSETVKTTYPKRTIKQQLEIERRVRKMVSDRKCRTYRKAEIVVQLIDMNFEEDEAITAANECSTLEQAISYLQQECLLCTGHFPVSQIVSMTHCEHRACLECIRAYFTVQIRDRTILDLLCPFCNEPDIGDEDVAQDYFNHLDIMLKKLVDTEIHELFQRKLRDRVLMKDPNFRWCSQCSSGFIAMPNLKRLVCPDCNAVTCASCRRLWERDHQGISCEAFAALKDSSDPEAQAAGLAKLLTEDGIDCPRCHFRYALAKGGCMHFRCIQCQHDFCSGCSRPFRMGQKCGVSDFCGKLGLHAHHPRNCLFYLRDKEPEDLQKLLELSGVEYNREPPDGMEPKTMCEVMEQKETADGMVDDYCGKEVQDGYAGLCRLHYVEYLGQLVNKHKVDPIQIFDSDDLELVLRRANIRLPPKRYRESDSQYRDKLVNLIQEELPLDKMDGS